MNFVLKPSLKHMGLVKIAVLLWSENGVMAFRANHRNPMYFGNEDRDWKKIEERVIAKVTQLLLPQILKEKVLGFIKPIGLQLLEWMNFHDKYLHLNLSTELCWTPQGTIDSKRTAEVLVKNENLDISTRYQLACIYCLEDDINELWNKVPEYLRESFLSAYCHIISIWTCDMNRRGENNACTSYKYKFKNSARDGLKAATEYFLQKLTPSEREESLIEAAKCVGNADVLSFLLSVMNEQQQIEVFKNNPSRILQCFLEWPFQSFFIETANRMWNFLSKSEYEMLLEVITNKHINGYKDWDYQKLFREFWQESPYAYKSFVTDNLDRERLILLLFCIEGKENFKLILKDAPFTAKKKLIYSERWNLFCHCSVHADDWDFLEFYIRECLPSKDEMLKFKEEFEMSIMTNCVENHFVKDKQRWNKLFCISDDSISKHDKRSVEEGESSSSKQFHSAQ